MDLWISNYWREYFYDNNGCIVKEIEIYNLGGSYKEWDYVVDENCQKEEAISINELGNENLIEYLYPDENNSQISIIYYPINNIWVETEKYEVIKNEKGDLIKNTRLLLNEFDPPNDTALIMMELYEYDYIEDLATGRVLSKSQKYYNNYLNIFSPPFFNVEFQEERKFDYVYYCDGLVHQEITSNEGESEPFSRNAYFYDGENNCFDFEQNLEMTISPNPSFGEIEVQSLIFESGDTELQVFTASGQLVFEKSISSRSHYQNVDLSGLGNGVYIIHLRSGKHISTSKLVMTQ